MKTNQPSKYHLYLIKFMDAKGSRLAEFLGKYGYKKENYFNNKDKAAILKWEDWKAKEIWEYIRKRAKNTNLKGLRIEYCPFCLYYDECNCCKYGANHSYCDGPKGLGGLISILDRLCINIDGWLEGILSNRWYNKTIREIEEE